MSSKIWQRKSLLAPQQNFNDQTPIAHLSLLHVVRTVFESAEILSMTNENKYLGIF